ncbi:hypothetical protein [Tolypothrix sp. PCC 7910]|nr:hypothetical protein [Tolypothrix sp. PCC 7910]
MSTNSMPRVRPPFSLNGEVLKITETNVPKFKLSHSYGIYAEV